MRSMHDHEAPIYAPRVNRSYDPVLRRWDHAPQPWVYKSGHAEWTSTRLRDTRAQTSRARWADWLAGTVLVSLAVGGVALLWWHPWL